MTPLQKKCLVASSGAHGLLLLTLLVSAAFRSEPAVTEEQVLTLVSPRILDTKGSGGETQAVVTPRPATPPTRSTPEEAAPQPRTTTQPARTAPLTEPKQHNDKTIAEKSSTSTPKTSPKTHEIVADLTHTTTTHARADSKPNESSATPETSRSNTDSRSEQVAQVAQVFGDTVSKIRESAAPATVVTMPGEGGGEAFVGYETAVYNAYYHAWRQPDASTSSQPVEVKIVVARDGSIISAEILDRSGDREMDRSVQRALDSVKQLPPFPSTTQDTQRSFKISFSLDTKQTSG